MEKRVSVQWLGPVLLLCVLSPAISNDCPDQCGEGYILRSCRCVRCRPGEYWYRRSGVGTCDRCTPECSAEKNTVEESPCTETTKRICYCRPGFYCPKPTEITCRTACVPCSKGTFSNTSSLRRSCQPHSRCASPDMVVISEGSTTQDRVCVYPTTKSKPATSFVPTTTFIPTTSSVPVTSSTPTTTTEPLTTSNPINVPSTTIPTLKTLKAPSPVAPLHSSPGLQISHDAFDSAAPHRTTRQASSLSTVTSSPSAKKGGSVQPSYSSRWMFVLLVAVFLLLVVTCLSMRCRGKSLKDKLDCPGFTFGKYQLQHLQKTHPVECYSDRGRSNTEIQLPVGRESSRSRGMGSGLSSGGNQQVTMDHSGKGENISNTVGSIFIYSPGMVVLGSNSKERKGEAEEISEEIPLMGVPQQESSLHPQEDSVGVGMQEEFGKELRFPVPATSK